MIRLWLRVRGPYPNVVANHLDAPDKVVEAILGDGHNVQISIAKLGHIIQLIGGDVAIDEPRGDPSSDFVVPE
jgi:hypothetical protein